MNNKKIKDIVSEVMEADETIVPVEELKDIISETEEVEPIVVLAETDTPAEEIIEDDVLIDISSIKSNELQEGDEISLLPDAKFISGNSIPSYLFDNKLFIRRMKDDKCSISSSPKGSTIGVVWKKDIIKYTEKTEIPFNAYLALIKAPELDIKSRPTEDSKTLKTIHYNGLFTVIGEKDNWGHLKIGGWIPLDKVKKIGV